MQAEREQKFEEQPALPDMELVNIIEGMSPEQRIEYKRQLLEQISDRESLVHLINDVNAAEGCDVDIIY